MVAWLAKTPRLRAPLPRIAVLAGFGAILSAFMLPSPAYADPLVLQTGAAVGSVFPVLLAVLALESIILALIIRRPFLEAVSVCLLANAITGFAGFVALLVVRMVGIPLLPPGPTALAAAVAEGVLISVMLKSPPVKRVFVATLTANAVTALIAVAVLAPLSLRAPVPGASQDLEAARGFKIIKEAIDAYHERYGYFPYYLEGGRQEADLGQGQTGDPLLASGILESYPPNPYAQSLRTRRFTAGFLLFGILPATRPADLNRPSTAWEARWFPLIQGDQRFGGPGSVLLSANGLSDDRVRDSFRSTFYHMNGRDYVPGCFFYRSYDFNSDGQPDDYILGAFGWPSGPGSVAADLIDGATGEIALLLDSHGRLHPGQPDGRPEAVLCLFVAGTPIPGS